MARTKKGSRGPGSEYWGRRPGNRHGATPGKITKQITHRKERRNARRILDQQPRQE